MRLWRICLHLALNVFQILFSVITAAIPFIAIGAANDLGDGAPGDGFIVLAVLAWAFVLGFVGVGEYWRRVGKGIQWVGISMARSLFALLVLNLFSSGIWSALSAHTSEGWIFSGLHWLCAVLCLWLLRTTGTSNWGRLVIAGLSLPVILLVGAMSYTRLNGGELLWQGSSPGGKTVAEVRRYRSDTCVELQSGLNPFRTCVFDAGGTHFSVRWIDEKDLQIQCENCGIDSTRNLVCSWRNVSIYYDFPGLPTPVHAGCP